LKVLRAPLVHFLAIGAALFVAERWLAAPGPEPLLVPASEKTRIHDELRRTLGRPPTERDLDFGLDAWIDEELLVREARALGWHRSDPVVQMRLVQNLRFVSEAAEAEAEPAALLDQAYALEMDRNDLVVRRRLAERMRLAITASIATMTPPEDALRALLVRDAERLRRPALVQLSHVYLSRDRRGENLAADAAATLERLQRELVPPAAAANHGDPFLVPAKLPLSSERALAARLGPEFGRSVIGASEGVWSGPVVSAYGLHLVWVHRCVEARDPGLEEVRSELVATWRSEQEEAQLRQTLDRLRTDAGLAPHLNTRN
jgi:hypothetical protein